MFVCLFVFNCRPIWKCCWRHTYLQLNCNLAKEDKMLVGQYRGVLYLQYVLLLVDIFVNAFCDLLRIDNVTQLVLFMWVVKQLMLYLTMSNLYPSWLHIICRAWKMFTSQEYGSISNHFWCISVFEKSKISLQMTKFPVNLITIIIISLYFIPWWYS